jgi:6-phosphogluconolactonase (cycloisomerase 2 family)
MGYGQAQGQFVFVNNETTPNTVSVFQVDADGALTPVPGSPFGTGGNGGRTRISDDFSNATIYVKNDLLFACNSITNSVSVFTIHPDGSLTAVAGSPFAAGGRFPIAVLTNPRGTLLFVSNHDTGNLSVFTIAPDGALSPIPGSPFDLRPLRQPTALAMNATGTMLVVGGENVVGVYNVNADGAVTPVGMPVETGLNTQTMVMTENDRFVYAVGLNAENGLAGFRLSSDGQLTPLAGSPFPAPSPSGLLGLAVNPRGNLLVATVSGEANVYLYRSDLGGNLSLAGSPVSTGGGELKAIRVDPTGTFVFAADVINHRIHVFRINALTRTLTEMAASPVDVGHTRARPSGIAFR